MNEGGDEILSTGFKELDRALGGGILPDSNILLVHETYSWGWSLGFSILANRIREGDYGVIMNSVLPLSSLETELKPVGVSIFELGNKGKLSIIDLFASIMKIEYRDKFVYKLNNISSETFVPKYVNLYMEKIRPKMSGHRPVGIDFTLDGLALIFDESTTIKIFQRFIAIKENNRLKDISNRPVNILIVNRDRVSKRFLSWFSLYSQYVIETIPETNNIERVEIKKSPLIYTQPSGLLYIKRENGRLVFESID